jgi:DNA-binding CsgD family transcriptional regulator/pimeloyl-ACP methyl ester carboxylesterase
MDAPPIQYATTADGLSIAFTDCGAGLPFIRTPFPYNNLRRMWQQHTNLSLYGPLAERFRLIQYDSRGQGMSSRDLSSDHTYRDYMLDLEAVVDRLELERFVLFGSLLSGHVVIEYAAEHPQKVAALLLHTVPMSNPLGGVEQAEERANQDWDAHLFTLAQINRRQGDARGDAAAAEYFRETITQADFLKMIRSGSASRIDALLPRVLTPTLITSERIIPHGEEDAMKLAASIPNARLVLFDGPFIGSLYTTDGSTPPIIGAIDDFMKSIAESAALGSRPDSDSGLSLRELEVLRLLAAGRSNQQIADDLVISLNTVRRHVSNVFDKTGAANRAQAAVYAKEHGIA